MQWVAFASSCTIFFASWSSFLWKAGRHMHNAPWQKKRSSVEDLGPHAPNPRPQVHSLLHLLLSTHFRTHFSAQFRTCERQPPKRARSALHTQAMHTRQPNGKNPRPLSPARQVSPGERKSQVPTQTSCSKRDVMSQDCETHK